MVKLDTMRKEFSEKREDEFNLSADPFKVFENWFKKAFVFYGEETNVFVLATTKKDNTPSSRVVLLKGMEQNKFIFFTNYGSDKAEELDYCPKASCNFYWPKIECQVRVLALSKKLSSKQSQDYFKLRPREAQLGAWASRQSHPIESREELLDAYDLYAKQFKNQEVPCPEFWGGYELEPYSFEFWWGRSNRLHDRVRYTKKIDGRWELERLAP